jgi:soluble lytic murein transglycosylase-like protein
MSSHQYLDDENETAVSPRGGCLSGFLLPPVMVLVVGGLLASFSLHMPEPVAAQALTSPFPDPGVSVFSFDGLSFVFTPEVQYWSESIQLWAQAAGLDPNLVATVMQIESCGDPMARSRSGAMGLFQVMPYHFDVSDDPYNPDTNALRGLAYLKRSLDAAEVDPRRAMAGYNGGISVISRGESTWAAETVRYAYWGSGIYTDAVNGTLKSLRLQEWLDAGGASLSNQAHVRLGLP